MLKFLNQVQCRDAEAGTLGGIGQPDRSVISSHMRTGGVQLMIPIPRSIAIELPENVTGHQPVVSTCTLHYFIATLI
jgi:hypothetical protein